MEQYQVDVERIDLNRELPQYPDPDDPDPDAVHKVQLQLSPVGAAATVHADPDLRSLVPDLLSSLEALHGADIVHRDVRLANIIRCHDRWVLIDPELAGRAGDRVWFDSKWLPERFRSLEDGYLPGHDLWMVGKIIASSYPSNVAICAFGEQLQAYVYVTAAEAIANIWST